MDANSWKVHSCRHCDSSKKMGNFSARIVQHPEILILHCDIAFRKPKDKSPSEASIKSSPQKRRHNEIVVSSHEAPPDPNSPDFLAAARADWEHSVTLGQTEPVNAKRTANCRINRSITFDGRS